MRQRLVPQGLLHTAAARVPLTAQGRRVAGGGRRGSPAPHRRQGRSCRPPLRATLETRNFICATGRCSREIQYNSGTSSCAHHAIDVGGLRFFPPLFRACVSVRIQQRWPPYHISHCNLRPYMPRGRATRRRHRPAHSALRSAPRTHARDSILPVVDIAAPAHAAEAGQGRAGQGGRSRTPPRSQMTSTNGMFAILYGPTGPPNGTSAEDYEAAEAIRRE